MNNFIYENSTKVYFGQGCVKEFLSSLTRDSRNILLACGEWSAKQYGVYDEVLNILMADEKNVVDFSGIMPNPTYEKVLEGIHLAKSHDIDLVLGIGGGSVMDCAKAVSLGARCSGDPWENFWERKGIVDSVLLLHPESATAAPCWQIWQVPETGRMVKDSVQELTRRMSKNG